MLDSTGQESTMFRTLSFCCALLALAAAMPLAAADKAPAPSRAQALKDIEQPLATTRRAAVERLGEVGTMADADRLVASLSDADAQVRRLAEAAMWRIWSRSGDRAIDALQARGVAQMEAGQLEQALLTFTDVIRRKPAFAEGWNKRATVLYLLGNYEQSMKDCDEVLKRNPQHFGALSGYGQMFIGLGEFERAIEYLERALEVNPNLPGAATAIGLLKQQLDDKRKKTI
jgi:tetratricopeptide (TPR) repeat protein